MDAHYPSNAPVPQDDLDLCTLTLQKLAGTHGNEDECFHFCESKHCRELRKAVDLLARRLSRKMFSGLSRSELEARKAVRRDEMGRQAQRRMLDRNHVDKAAMRLGRLERLAELQRQGEHLPLVADGVSSHACSCEVADPVLAELYNPRACYTCKRRFYLLHQFYSDLCPDCAALNWQKRNQTCDCSGKVALVTGGRVKIGFHVVLKLLRWGAHVIVTTRFPCDCARRLAEQADEEGSDWSDRIDIYGLDLRDISAVERFCAFCNQSYQRLDILINNACQTVRRPAGFYGHLLAGESSARSVPGGPDQMLHRFQQWRLTCDPAQDRHLAVSNVEDAVDLGIAPSAVQSQMALVAEDSTAEFPDQILDANGQQVDLRLTNTWVMRMEEVETAELAEVFLINAMAPFIINARLQGLVEKAQDGLAKVIINVSAMEGKFYRTKAPYHPHTNMAKAALNQLTRTVAGDLAKKHIYMCAVDTGWINDENPLEKARQYGEQHHFQCPLDEVDAASRILDPVVLAFSQDQPLWDVFLKDYMPTEW